MNDRTNLLSFIMPWLKRDNKEYEDEIKDNIDSFAAPDNADGANEVEHQDASALGKAYNQNFYSTGTQTKNTTELINRYRGIANYHEVDNAIDEIVNDAIVQEDNKDTVFISMEKSDWPESVKNTVNEEFKEVLRLLEFEQEGKRLFRRWYIDSRIYFHKMVDPNKPKEGIKELRRLDPRNIEYVREIYKETGAGGVSVYKAKKEYFAYHSNSNGTNNNIAQRGGSAQARVIIPYSAMTYAHSGKTGTCGKSIIGHLHHATRPANQLKMMEDAMVIYRITRAPERRVFYIDVGNMPGKKATSHLNNVMQGLKNRVVYDTNTGKVKNHANNLSMTEDYWLMRRDGKATTEVTTLPGAQSLGDMDDVRWFNRKLYEALKIPLSRLPQEGGGVSFGGGGEITRDELNFTKYVRGLQQQFEAVLLDPLKTNLILKGIMTEDEWDEEEENIKVIFAKDSYFEELKDTEVLERRIATMEALQAYTGKYISNEYVMKNVLKMSDEEIEVEAQRIEDEAGVKRFQTDEEELEDF